MPLLQQRENYPNISDWAIRTQRHMLEQPYIDCFRDRSNKEQCQSLLNFLYYFRFQLQTVIWTFKMEFYRSPYFPHSYCCFSCSAVIPFLLYCIWRQPLNSDLCPYGILGRNVFQGPVTNGEMLRKQQVIMMKKQQDIIYGKITAKMLSKQEEQYLNYALCRHRKMVVQTKGGNSNV